MDRDVDDPCSSVKIQKLGIGVVSRKQGIISVCHHQVGCRPLRGHALGAPMEGMSVDKLGGLCASQRNVFPTLFVACCAPHPSWWYLWLPCEFPHPGNCEGPKECPLGLAVLE